MKKFIALALVTLGVSVSARAQWIVFDPTMNVQSILNTAQEVAKFVEMINNQVQQIQKLTDQLNEFKHYESLFGDPKAVVLTTVQPLGTGMLCNANRLFQSIGLTFNRLKGALQDGVFCTSDACKGRKTDWGNRVRLGSGHDVSLSFKRLCRFA